jgi:hypothetical protein
MSVSIGVTLLSGETKEFFEKTPLHYHLSTKKLTWTLLALKKSHRGDRPATNRLSHGTASPKKADIINK